MRLLQSVRARHSLPPMAQGISPEELPSFYPILFKSVSTCFKMFHNCCFALPARVNLHCCTLKIVIVPSTTLPMTNNLSIQGVLGGTLKSVDCQSFLLRSVVLFFLARRGPPGSWKRRWVEISCVPWRADAYPITIRSSTHYCFTLHTTVSHHHHIIIFMITTTTRLFLT